MDDSWTGPEKLQHTLPFESSLRLIIISRSPSLSKSASVNPDVPQQTLGSRHAVTWAIDLLKQTKKARTKS